MKQDGIWLRIYFSCAYQQAAESSYSASSSNARGTKRALWAKRRSKSWIGALLTNDDVFIDATEQKLKDAIPKSEGDVQRHLKGLLSAYSRLKDNRSHGIGHELSRCFTITDGSRDGVVKSKIEILREDKSATFSEFTQAFSRCLDSGCPEGLRVVVLCFEPMTKGKRGFLTTFHKIIATFRGRFPSLPLVPNSIIAFLIEQYLKEKVPTLVASPTPHIRDDQRRLLRPPSLSFPRGNLDPRKFADDLIELAWQYRAPIYTSDFDIYIWEQYKSLPNSQRAVLKLYPGTATRETALLILFQRYNSLALFSHLRGYVQAQGSTSTTISTWSTNSEVLLSICYIYRVVIFETANFLAGCSVELERMHLLARQNPNAAKVRYLVHLEDCRSSAYRGVTHGLEVLDSVARWADTLNISQLLWDAGEPFVDRFAVLRKDLDFLGDHFLDIEKQMKELQQTLHDHIELTHNRRNFILSIGAAIYLPLSFATSFFGMNINTTTPAGPEGFSNWTTSWITSSPIDLQNSTKALVSSIGSSGTLSYRWKTFIITASCLLITLPLSLAIGGVLRVFYRQTMHYAIYWRIIAIIPGLAVVFFSIWEYHWFEGFESSFAIYFALNAILFAVLGFKTLIAWVSKENRLLWTTIVLGTFLFGVGDWFVAGFPKKLRASNEWRRQRNITAVL